MPILNSIVSDVLERRNTSRRWLQENFWGEFAEVWRMMKCRTAPIVNPTTNKEDKTRTNVCMPDVWITTRRKSSRLSAKPPVLRVRAETQAVGDYFSGLAMLQWDRAEEQRIQRRHVLQASLFGLSVKQHGYDKVIASRRFRRKTEDELAEIGVVMDEESNALRLPRQAEIEQGTARKPQEFSRQMVEDLIALLGPEMARPVALKKYEGPISRLVFLGDFYPEPEFENLHSSGWITTEWKRDIDWLAHWAKKEFTDPRTGETQRVFDEKAVQDLIDMGSYSAETGKDESLKQQLRSEIYKTEPLVNVKLRPQKQFQILEEYVFIDGWPHVRWVGNEKVLLNKRQSDDDPEAMPLPWDLYGHYPFSALTPIADLLWGVGDSSARIGRHLVNLHNATVSSRQDLVIRALKPLVPVREGADIPAEIHDLGALRVIYMRHPQDIGQPIEIQIPREAWESEAQIMRMLQLLEPAMIDFGEQSQAVPGTQQVATIAALQNRVQESLSQDELEQLNLSLAEETKIKLWMWQQMMQEVPEVPEQFFKAFRTEQGGGTSGSARVSIADPLELQEDFEVQPEMASTLAVDDEFRRSQAERIYVMASADPITWNKRGAARQLANTFRGVQAEELINPEQPETPQGPETRASISLSIKWEQLPAPVQNELLEKLGLQPSPELEVRGALKGIEEANLAGKAAQELLEEPSEEVAVSGERKPARE